MYRTEFVVPKSMGLGGLGFVFFVFGDLDDFLRGFDGDGDVEFEGWWGAGGGYGRGFGDGFIGGVEWVVGGGCGLFVFCVIKLVVLRIIILRITLRITLTIWSITLTIILIMSITLTVMSIYIVTFILNSI